tara:strand:- start:154 stop:333 length:180 start_codon:yes stop_codon:yes gene_type:complete
MIERTRPDMQVADSFGETYDINMGDKKRFDKAYEKFCKKRNMQVGWNKRTLQYGNKEKE